MKAMFLASAAALALTATAQAGTQQAGGVQPGMVHSSGEIVPDNTLLEEWSGLFDGVPPFDLVSAEDFPVALDYAIGERRREILAIANNPLPATFENTIEAMEYSGDRLGRVGAVFGVMTNNMASPEIQALQREWGPKFAAAADETIFNPQLFQRVKAVYDSRETAGLNDRQKRLVTRTYNQFIQRGANLSPEQKEQLSAYNQELAGLFAQFSSKLLADEETHVVATEADMAGVPGDVKAAAAAAARARGLPEGQYAIVNTRSAVDPILTFADNRALRERIWRAFVNRGDNGNANDTNEIIARIVKLRADRARLLGYESHAHWRMQDTMAGTPDRAEDLMMRVWPAAVARVQEEVRDQQQMAQSLGHDITIEPWDYRYYMEKVRKARFDLSQEELKPYFQLDTMIEAMFYMAGQLYGFEFTENSGDVPVWHPDIRTWHVARKSDGGTVGVFYGDMFARAGKQSGAWATTYRSRSGLLGDDIVLGSNNNNFVKPGAGDPVLISLDDARVLFHEFGHAIHYFQSDVYYPSLIGAPRDFLEYPSQVHENWLLTPEILNRFARHYQTGEIIPQEMVERIEAAAQFNQGFATVEYMSSALVDMALHTDPVGEVDPDAFERETLVKLGMPAEIVMRHRLPQFDHLFSSDTYSAGYYSYLWSETMDADTWAAFEEGGNVWDPEMARKFTEILLSTGNETDRAEAYRQFRGRDPDVDALLRRRGFPVSGQ